MRLLTTPNLDGVLCAVMISKMEGIGEIVFAHASDIQNDIIEVKDGDAIANLPHHPNCTLWFDHHPSALFYDYHPSASKWFSHRLNQAGTIGEKPRTRGKAEKSTSSARLVYEYYNDEKLKQYEHILDETDRLAGADLTYDDVLRPEEWILLGYTLDPRTGLGGVDEYPLTIIKSIRDGMDIKEILELNATKGRIKRYLHEENKFKRVLMENTREHGNVCVTDFRGIDDVPCGNRFLVYPYFARCNVSLRVYDHSVATRTVIAVGKNIFDSSHPAHIGDLMSDFGGGGVSGAGAVQINAQDADKTIDAIIAKLKE